MNAQVRPGYKLTEVGVIPEDWECKVIHELLEARAITSHLDGNHGELYPRSEEFKEYGIPYIGANDFFNGRVDLNNCKFLAKERASLFRKGVARSGDILFAHNATVGPVAELNTDLEFVILSTTATYFRCNEELLHNNYLKQFLKSDFFIAQYVPVMSQSTRNQVPITTQRKLCVIVPPLKEQRLIAVALSDMDALISGLDQLIAKKRDIKRAAMQQLLNGQQRLPGFGGEWELKQFFDVISRVNGQNNKIQAANYKSYGAFPVVDQGKDYVVGYSDESDRVYSCPSDGVIVFGDHTCIIKYIDFDFIVGADGVQIIRAKDGECARFLAYKLEISGITSTGYNRHFKLLKELEFLMPSLKEQTAIANILSDMEVELVNLETRRDKARQLKQGMMQELLTGRIRLSQSSQEAKLC